MNIIDNIKCTRFRHLHKLLVSSFCQFIESNDATEYLSLFSRNRPFAAYHSRCTKPPCWGAKVALGECKQRTLPYKIICIPFVGLSPVRLLRPSMAFLYHVYDKLQRAYISPLIIACHLPTTPHSMSCEIWRTIRIRNIPVKPNHDCQSTSFHFLIQHPQEGHG